MGLLAPKTLAIPEPKNISLLLSTEDKCQPETSPLKTDSPNIEENKDVFDPTGLSLSERKARPGSIAVVGP